MPIYVFGAFRIHDRDGYDKYAELAGQAMHEFTASGRVIEPLSVDGNPKVYEGNKPADHLVLTRFGSKEEYEFFVASRRYQEALPYRLASSTTLFMMAMDSI